jgi:hypothetical protein
MNSRETFPLPWRHVDLPFDGGGYDRIAYLIVAANDDEVGIMKDLRSAQIVCATNNLDIFAESQACNEKPELASASPSEGKSLIFRRSSATHSAAMTANKRRSRAGAAQEARPEYLARSHSPMCE